MANTRRSKDQRFTPEQLAVIESFYLLGEIIGELHGAIQLSLGPIAGIDDEAISDIVSDEIVEGLGSTLHQVWVALHKYRQLLEIGKDEITDRMVEKLLARSDVTYASPNDDVDVAEDYTSASLGTLGWKLEDRLNYLLEQTYLDDKADPSESEPSYVTEIEIGVKPE